MDEPLLNPNEYRCAFCKRVFQHGWTDEEARQEAKEIFGKRPEEWERTPVLICDDCFNALDPRNNPELVDEVKKVI